MIFVSCLSFVTLLRGLDLGSSLAEVSRHLALSMIKVEFACELKQRISSLVSWFDQA